MYKLRMLLIILVEFFFSCSNDETHSESILSKEEEQIINDIVTDEELTDEELTEEELTEEELTDEEVELKLYANDQIMLSSDRINLNKGDYFKTIKATATRGIINYSILSQEPNNSITISEFGDIYINEESSFEPELNELIIVSLKISVEDIFKTINLEIKINDFDERILGSWELIEMSSIIGVIEPPNYYQTLEFTRESGYINIREQHHKFNSIERKEGYYSAFIFDEYNYLGFSYELNPFLPDISARGTYTITQDTLSVDLFGSNISLANFHSFEKYVRVK